jgi:ABC-type transport system substrate-binding protein
VWLSTTTISQNGSIGLNFARNNDPTLQKYLEQGRSLPNGPDRVKAYQNANEQLARDVPYVWLGRSFYSAVAQSRVQNFAGLTMPDGSKGYGFDEAVIWPSQIWLS